MTGFIFLYFFLFFLTFSFIPFNIYIKFNTQSRYLLYGRKEKESERERELYLYIFDGMESLKIY